MMNTELTPVIDDMSITLLAGRVPSAAPAIEQAQEAERLGFKRVWIPERYSNKEAGVLLGAMAASTSRIGVGSGPLSIASRYPVVTAALGATLHSVFGPRMTLGVGRGGPPAWYNGHGFTQVNYPTLIDYVDVIKRLWRGETIEHEGPAGNYKGLRLPDPLEGPAPDVVFFHLGGPVASKAAANPVFDGVGLANITTPDAMRESIAMTRKECERIGRDPATLKFIAPVTSAPELDEFQTRVQVAVRIVVYLKLPILGDMLLKLNRWDERIANDIRNHPLLANPGTGTVDQSFQRDQLVEVSKMVPDAWLGEVAAVGSVHECVKTLQRYRDAGADEIDLYGSTPAENAALIRAWAVHKAGRS